MRFTLPLALCLLHSWSAAALGPQNVIVVARADSLDSLRIANAYVAARNIPRGNLVLVPYAGSPHDCTFEVFERDVLKPVKKALEQRKIDKSIHVWATTLGIPWRIDGNGLSGVVHFGKVVKPTKSPLLGPAGFEEQSKYGGVWLSIDAFNGLAQSGRRPLHMHLAAGSVDATLKMIERSAKADGTMPDGTFYLCDGAGPRSTRKVSIPQAMQLLKAQGAKVEHLAVSQFTGKTDVIGLFTGDISFPTTQNTFLPGALADHLTSTGGILDGTGGQMMCTAFLDAGCAASYGTVVEPYNYPAKFPAAAVHAAYRAGFTAVESYWMSIAWPFQGVFVGDPLCRPYGKGPELQVKSPTAMQVVGDELPLDVQVKPASANGGIGGLEIRIDQEAAFGVGQQRLPSDAAITLKIGDKEYIAVSPAQPVLASLFESMKEQLKKDGWEVSTTAASLMMLRTPKSPTPMISVTCRSSAIRGEVVGGKIHPPVEGVGKEFAWLRFSTGPQSASLRVNLKTAKAVDGLHHLSVIAVAGDETTTASRQTISVVKRTKPDRLRMKALQPRISLSKGRINVAEASFEGTGLTGPVEFRIDERTVETRLKPPFVLSVDPKSLGVGTHVIRARTTSPLQEADDEITLYVDP
jgi:uncharacterized protein (TIGR03790 family)